MNRMHAIFLFTLYSYGAHLLFALLDLMPHPLRIVLFRFWFKQIGAAPLIDYKTYARYPSKIRLGNNVAINRGCQLYASQRAEAGTITIGNNVALGPNVTIFTAGHDYSRHDLPDIAAPVVLHDHVWVGGHSIILPGVTLGEGAVVGAGSVVTKDVPAYHVVAGNPARIINERIIAKSGMET